MGSRLLLPSLARRIGLLEAPTVTAGHVSIGAAAVLGFSFAVAHLATVIVTCATVGFGWGVNAWMFDMMGFFAGFLLTLAAVCSWLLVPTSAISGGADLILSQKLHGVLPLN